MKSLGGAGGAFDDIEFCDTSVTDAQTGTANANYQWWQSFSEGKRFYVPDVAKFNGSTIVFNITALTDLGNQLIRQHPTRYPNFNNFGRKSFDKIVANESMSFPKAILATRVINEYLALQTVQGDDDKVLQIGKGRVLMSGYRVAGLSKAIGYYQQSAQRQPEVEGALELLVRESGVASSIIDALSHDDTKFVVFSTALEITKALLRNRHVFGLAGDAVENTLLKLGPPPATSYSRLDLRLSVPETGDPKLGIEKDPRFAERTARCPHPDNPFRNLKAA